MAVQSQDIASLFKELDSFLTSVQKVVKVIEKKDDDTPIKPRRLPLKLKRKVNPTEKSKNNPNLLKRNLYQKMTRKS